MHGGVLIHSLETAEGELVVGPLLCVDAILSATKSGSIAERARVIAGRPALDATSPLHLLEEPTSSDLKLFRSAHVGLTPLSRAV